MHAWTPLSHSAAFAQVLTPVRRSARKKTAPVQPLAADNVVPMLEATNWAYAGNTAFVGEVHPGMVAAAAAPAATPAAPGASGDA